MGTCRRRNPFVFGYELLVSTECTYVSGIYQRKLVFCVGLALGLRSAVLLIMQPKRNPNTSRKMLTRVRTSIFVKEVISITMVPSSISR